MGAARRAVLALLVAALCPGVCCDGAPRRSLQGAGVGVDAHSHVAILVQNLDVSGLDSLDSENLKKGIAAVIAQAAGVPVGHVRATEDAPGSVVLEPGSAGHFWLPSEWRSASAVQGQSTLVTGLLYIPDSTSFIVKAALGSQTFQDNFAGELVEHCDPSTVSGHIYFDQIAVLPDHQASTHNWALATPEWTSDATPAAKQAFTGGGYVGVAHADPMRASPSVPTAPTAGPVDQQGGEASGFSAVDTGRSLMTTLMVIVLVVGAYQYLRKMRDESALLEWMRANPQQVESPSFMGFQVPESVSSMLEAKPVGYTGH